MTDADAELFQIQSSRNVWPDEASAADRIAAAPRAWVVEWLNSPELGFFVRRDKGEASSLLRRVKASEGGEWRMYGIALVPLTEKEASQ